MSDVPESSTCCATSTDPLSGPAVPRPNADVDADIAARVATFDIGAELNAQGLAVVYLEGDRVVRRLPDGTIEDLGGIALPASTHTGLCESDRVAVSVAAYAPHVESYAARNAGGAEALFERFVAPLCAADDVILDAGCGPGRDLVRFAERGHCVVGVDLSVEMLAAAGAATEGWPVRLELADLRALPFEDDSFAAAWACASLVHLGPADVHVALGELARVVRSGGPVTVSVKAAVPGTSSGFSDTDHGRRFFHYWSPEEVRAAAAASGLTVSSVELDDRFVNLWATA